MFWCLSIQSLISCCQLLYKSCFCHTLQSDQEMVPCYSTEWKAFTPERWYFYFWSVHEAPLKLFHFCNLLQMPNDYRMLNIEFLGKFLCSCKRISFDDCSQLFMVNFWWPATGILIFAKIPVQNVLNLLQIFLNLWKNSETICKNS